MRHRIPDDTGRDTGCPHAEEASTLEVPIRDEAQALDEDVCDELVRAREENAQLKEALHSRTVIGQATGVLMATANLDPAEAFAELTRMSSHTNRKLRDIAAEVVATAGAARTGAPETRDSGRPSDLPESLVLLSELAPDAGQAPTRRS